MKLLTEQIHCARDLVLGGASLVPTCSFCQSQSTLSCSLRFLHQSYPSFHVVASGGRVCQCVKRCIINECQLALMNEITYWNILFLYFTLLYPLLGKKGWEEVGRFALLQVFLESCNRVQVGIS